MEEDGEVKVAWCWLRCSSKPFSAESCVPGADRGRETSRQREERRWWSSNVSGQRRWSRGNRAGARRRAGGLTEAGGLWEAAVDGWEGEREVEVERVGGD